MNSTVEQSGTFPFQNLQAVMMLTESSGTSCFWVRCQKLSKLIQWFATRKSSTTSYLDWL